MSAPFAAVLYSLCFLTIDTFSSNVRLVLVESGARFFLDNSRSFSSLPSDSITSMCFLKYARSKWPPLPKSPAIHSITHISIKMMWVYHILRTILARHSLNFFLTKSETIWVKWEQCKSIDTIHCFYTTIAVSQLGICCHWPCPALLQDTVCSTRPKNRSMIISPDTLEPPHKLKGSFWIFRD